MKILIVEDEALVSLLIEDMVEGLGHIVVGPAGCVADSMALIRDCELAILDVNLSGGETSFEVADALLELNTPFLFTTGSSGEAVMNRYGDVPKLIKPFDYEALGQVLKTFIIP